MERKAIGGKSGGKSRNEGRERRGRDESGSERGEGRAASWMLGGGRPCNELHNVAILWCFSLTLAAELSVLWCFSCSLLISDSLFYMPKGTRKSHV